MRNGVQQRVWLSAAHAAMIITALVIGFLMWLAGGATWPSVSFTLLLSVLVTFAWLAAAVTFPFALDIGNEGCSLVYVWGREMLKWPALVGLRRKRFLGIPEFRLLLGTGKSIGLGFLGRNKVSVVEKAVSERARFNGGTRLG